MRRSGSRFAVWTMPAALLAVGCAVEPDYPSPTNDEARRAYIRAIRADRIEGPPRRSTTMSTAILPGDGPGGAGIKAASVLSAEAERNDRAMASSRIGSLARVALGPCEWVAIDPDGISPYGRERASGTAHGYRCDYEVFHNTTTRGLVSAEGEGYFFRRDGSYDFGGIEEATFREVRP